MKKLLKINNYHYVIDTAITNDNGETFLILATDNYDLKLPPISNIEECLNLVGKEVIVEYYDIDCEGKINHGKTIFPTKYPYAAMIKPVSSKSIKEDSCESCKHSKTSAGVYPFLYCNHPEVVAADDEMLMNEEKQLCTNERPLFEHEDNSTSLDELAITYVTQVFGKISSEVIA